MIKFIRYRVYIYIAKYIAYVIRDLFLIVGSLIISLYVYYLVQDLKNFYKLGSCSQWGGIY